MYGVVSFFSSRDCKFSKSSISCKILASFPYFPGDVSLEVIPADDGDALLMLFRPLRALMPFLSEEKGVAWHWPRYLDSRFRAPTLSISLLCARFGIASVRESPRMCTHAAHYPRRSSGVLSGLLTPLHRQTSSDLRFRNMVFSVNQISDLLLFRA